MESLEFPSDVAGEPAEVWVVGSKDAPPCLTARLRGSASTGSRSVLDELADGVLLADDHLNFVDANAAACHLTGYPLEQLRRLGIEDLLDPESTPEPKSLWQRFQQKGSQTGRCVLKAGDGTRRLIIYRAWANVLTGYHLTLLRPA